MPCRLVAVWIGAAALMSGVAGSAGCDRAPPLGANPPPVCHVTAPTSCPDPAPSYAEVAPIIERRCISCHFSDDDGAWTLNDYESVADWADLIRADLLSCTMPPPDSGIFITEAERSTLLTWIRCDYPK